MSNFAYLVNHGKLPLEVEYMDGPDKVTCMVNPGRAKIPASVSEEDVLTQHPSLVYQVAPTKTKIEPVVEQTEVEDATVENAQEAKDQDATDNKSGKSGNRRN